MHVVRMLNTGALVCLGKFMTDGRDRAGPVGPISADVKTLELRIQDSLARERMVADLSTAFGLLALALAAVRNCNRAAALLYPKISCRESALRRPPLASYTLAARERSFSTGSTRATTTGP